MRSGFHINRTHDPRDLARNFRAKGRLHIPQFLEPEGADRLLTFLKLNERWRLVINSGEKLFEVDRSQQAALSPDERRQLDDIVYANARYGFQFRYETMRVPDAECERKSSGTPLDEFAMFLSDDPALDFFRTLLSEPSLSFADAQGTAYGPGHFLTAHDDAVDGKNRKAAFVMNLSRDWPVDWGGLLTFHNAGDPVVEGLIPTFNSLNVFSVPQVHSVSIVAPFAARRRYSVTGWLRNGPKP